MITIYHNPRCRKSREALQWLSDHGYTPEIVEYLKAPLSREALADLLEKLEMEPGDLIRRNESIWKETYRGRDLSRDELLGALAEHPKLMERPVVVTGSKAVVARPADRISELFDN